MSVTVVGGTCGGAFGCVVLSGNRGGVKVLAELVEVALPASVDRQGRCVLMHVVVAHPCRRCCKAVVPFAELSEGHHLGAQEQLPK